MVRDAVGPLAQMQRSILACWLMKRHSCISLRVAACCAARWRARSRVVQQACYMHHRNRGGLCSHSDRRCHRIASALATADGGCTERWSAGMPVAASSTRPTEEDNTGVTDEEPVGGSWGGAVGVLITCAESSGDGGSGAGSTFGLTWCPGGDRNLRLMSLIGAGPGWACDTRAALEVAPGCARSSACPPEATDASCCMRDTWSAEQS
jgi:hypothetical protein